MAVPKRFAVVRFFGTFLKVIAWIIVVLATLGAISAVVVGNTGLLGNIATDAMVVGNMPINLFGTVSIAGAIGILIAGLFNFLLFYALGEFIHMSLALEENTRLTAALLLRMHQDSRIQEEQEAYGDSGFVSETYE